MTTRETVTLAIIQISSEHISGTVESHNAWRDVKQLAQTTGQSLGSVDQTNQCQLVLDVPDKLTTLCQFVAAAQKSGLQYKVALYGHPILDYSSAQ